MRQMIGISVITICSVMFSLTSTEGGALATDTEEVLVSIDYRSSGGAKRIGDSPTMSIYATGLIEIPANYAGQKRLSGQLTNSELEELMAFVREQHKFFDFDIDQFRRDVDNTPPPFAASSRLVVTISANHGSQSRSVTFPTNLSGNSNPNSAHLLAVKKRLDQTRVTVQLGGRAELEKWLKLVNSELLKKYPAASPLKVVDLAGGGTKTDGSTFVNFSRRIASNDSKSEMVSVVFITKQQNGALRVRVTHKKQPLL